jgi:hypothetical protein
VVDLGEPVADEPLILKRSPVVGIKLERIPFDDDRGDFASWKFRMEALFRGYGLLDIVEGRVNAGEEFAAHRDAAYSIIALSLSDASLKHIHAVPRGDAAAAWQKLCDQYERKMRASKLMLRRQLYNVVLLGNLGVENAIGNIEMISSRLSLAGVPVHDDEKIAVLMASLPGAYDSICVLVENSDGITFDEAVAKIRDYEARSSFNAQEKYDHGQPTMAHRANVKSGGAGGARSPPDYSSYRCHNCGKMGHIQRACPDAVKAKPAHVNQYGVWSMAGYDE